VAGGGYLALVTETDPLVPVLAGLVVDLVWWLDSCDDEEVDPESAVKMLETVSWVLLQVPAGQRARLLEALAELAEAEKHPGRREFLLAFPSTAGLAGDDSETPGTPWPAWVHPADR
jgi:hypothetical protein